MQEPPTPVDERQILPWARKLVEWLRENRVDVGPGLRIRRTRTNSIITLAQQPATTQEKPVPLHLITRRPPYIPKPAEEPAGGAKRIFVEWGTLNDQLATNWDSHWDITDTTYFFAVASLRATDTLKVLDWSIETGSDYDTHVTADWPIGSERPTEVAILLGVTTFSDGSFQGVSNSGGGSLALTEHIQSINANSAGNGAVDFGKQLVFSRLNY